MSHNEDNSGRFLVLEKLFKIAGTPVAEEGGSLLYRVYRPVVVLSGYLTFLTTFIGIVRNVEDMDYVMEAARPGFVMINLLWMHFFISINMDGVRNLLTATEEFTWVELPTRENDSGSLTMAGWIQRIQPLVWKLNFCDWGTHLLYFVLRGVTSDGKPFFFNAWFPLDTDFIPTYVLVLIMQTLGSVMLGTTLFAVMGLYVVLVSVGCTQLQKLQAALGQFRQQEQDEMYAILVRCVQHHQQVIKYMKELEKTFSPVLFGPFLSVVAALCFTAYTAITLGGKFVEIIQIFLITGAMMFQIQAVCWFGTELTKQSGRIRNAAWESDWVGAPVPFQRWIIFMICVSKEFRLTAGKIIPVYQSTVMVVRGLTVVKVMNQTYTYLMVLLNFVQKTSK